MASSAPAAQGFAMPAEWALHDATWLAWPHDASGWPGRFAPVPWAFAELVRQVARSETVHLSVLDAAHERRARGLLERAGVPLGPVDFRRFPTDRPWSRHHGPIWLTRGGEKAAKAIAGFRFDGWARHPDHRRDARLPERVARALKAPLLPVVHAGREVVLEGGAVEVNGRGTVLATEACLLDPAVQVRNPGFGRADYEQVFREVLAARNTIWLGRGIAGDDAHGHVDELARFTDPRTIVLCREEDPRDPNHAALEGNRERLEGARLEDGSRPELVFLPMPSPVVFDGQRLPASYANFYACNAAVLVPTFDDARDRVALGLLGELFRDRPVVGIHARHLLRGVGALHALTQQEPALPGGLHATAAVG